MKGVKIEIVKAAEDSDDGDVLIRLLDVFELPEAPEFRIDPLDDDARGDDRSGWPTGKLTATKMRVGEKGVEMSVSADVMDWPALLPGTPVAVSVPSASIREELRWPSLAALHSARRGIVVVSAEKRRAEIAARAKARRAELESMTAVRQSADAAASELPEVESTTAVAVGEGLSRLDVKRKGTMKLVASSDTAKSPTQFEQQALLTPPTPETAPESKQKSEEISPPTVVPPAVVPSGVVVEPDKVAAPPPASVRSSPPAPMGRIAAPASPTATDPPIPSYYAPNTTEANVAPAARVAARSPSATPPPLPVRSSPQIAASKAVAPAEQTHSLPAHTPKFLTRPGEQAPRPYTFQRAFGMGFLVAAVLALASTFALRGGGDFASLMSPQATEPPTTRVAERNDQPSMLTSLSAIVAVPEISTRGEQAATIDLAGALSKADQSLSGTSNADKDEAKYWLRRSLALGLGEQRLVWALTQLGTLYAAPAVGAPDYASARTLWELAAAQGDPIALCFLASLHEHGLGGPKDEVRALVLYRNAKTHGGCRNVDQSIARLTKGAP